MARRALMSVSDKSGLDILAKILINEGWEVISTGGTAHFLRQQGIVVQDVSQITKFPEMMDGRVKTLHPSIHGGILARRDHAPHMEALGEHGIGTIDMVVCNLYPFKATVATPGVTEDEAVENIDIGGPAMIRAAAKNYEFVTVIVDPADYHHVGAELQAQGKVSYERRKTLAAKAFSHTASYDGAVAHYLQQEMLPAELHLSFTKAQDLRYGENPHQRGAVYKSDQSELSVLRARQLQGKALSYNNILDTDAALRLVLEFAQPTAVAVKHGTPCGVAVAEDIVTAYKRAYDADPVSIFGGIVALNRTVDVALAQKLGEIFLEVVLAPRFTSQAIEILQKKKNLRLLEIADWKKSIPQALEIRSVLGGIVVQERDILPLEEEPWQVVTQKQPSPQEMQDLQVAARIVKHVKSNAIVVVKDGRTLGIGCGQVNRIDAARYALTRDSQSYQGAVLASEALLPFADVIDEAAEAGVTAVVQPGGAIRDKLSIEAANRHGMAMIFTGVRHFKH